MAKLDESRFTANSNALLLPAAMPPAEAAGWDLRAPNSNENRSAVAVASPAASFVCVHLDAYAEANRLAQLEGLRAHLSASADLADVPFFLLGDFNSLRRGDWSDEEWAALVARRAGAGIASETAVTELLEAPLGEGGWGLTDCRQLADRVEGPVASCPHGSRIDYCYGSAAALRRWRPTRVAHVDVAGLTDHTLVVCDLEAAEPEPEPQPMQQQVVHHQALSQGARMALDAELYCAAETGDAAAINRLVAQGASPDAAKLVGGMAASRTPALVAAAERGHAECVRALLAAGANPLSSWGGDDRQRNGKTALDLAGSAEVAALLRTPAQLVEGVPPS